MTLSIRRVLALLLALLSGVAITVTIGPGGDTQIIVKPPPPPAEAQHLPKDAGDPNLPVLASPPKTAATIHTFGLAKAAGAPQGWLPGAQIVAGRSAGSFTGGGRKIGEHTTEGCSAAGAIGAYRATGSWPHFTLQYGTGCNASSGACTMYQHIPLTQAARSFEHPSGPETNRANVIQIEQVGRASESPRWSAGHYACIRLWNLRIAKAFGVPNKLAGLPFRSSAIGGGPRFSGQGFVDASGYLGHQHVPQNHHTDPGAERMDLVVGPLAQPVTRHARSLCQELNRLRGIAHRSPEQARRAGAVKKALAAKYVCRAGPPGSIRRR